jgi:hypothetical protein
MTKPPKVTFNVGSYKCELTFTGCGYHGAWSPDVPDHSKFTDLEMAQWRTGVSQLLWKVGFRPAPRKKKADRAVKASEVGA